MVQHLAFLIVHLVFPEFYSSTVPNESNWEVPWNRGLDIDVRHLQAWLSGFAR